MNVGVQGSAQVPALGPIGCSAWGENAGSAGDPVFSFVRNCPTVLRSLRILADTWCCPFFYPSHLVSARWRLSVAFWFAFPSRLKMLGISSYTCWAPVCGQTSSDPLPIFYQVGCFLPFSNKVRSTECQLQCLSILFAVTVGIEKANVVVPASSLSPWPPPQRSREVMRVTVEIRGKSLVLCFLATPAPDLCLLPSFWPVRGHPESPTNSGKALDRVPGVPARLCLSSV